jgi:hypothetical protein
MSFALDPITVRDALRLFWDADRYPILGNEDRRASDRLEVEARAKAADAIAQPDDPPEFARWLAALRDRSLPNPARDAIMEALYDWFDPEPPCNRKPAIESLDNDQS